MADIYWGMYIYIYVLRSTIDVVDVVDVVDTIFCAVMHNTTVAQKEMLTHHL